MFGPRRALVVAILLLTLLGLAAPASAGPWGYRPRSSSEPTPSPTPTPSASPSPSPSPTPEPSPSPTPDPSALLLETRAGRLLAEIGDVFTYSIAVTNPGDEPLEDVVVIDTVPTELTVYEVPLLDTVDAVQVGAHLGKEDIVWVLAPIPPGETVEVTWKALAWSPGDLKAVNKVTAHVDSSSVQQQSDPAAAAASSTTYLGKDAAEATTNPPYRKLERRMVTVAATDSGSALGAPALLPATGSDPTRLIWTASLAIAAGCLLIAVSGRGRRVALATVAALFLATGCTTEEAPPQARSITPPLERPRPDASDEVLGLRIQRDDFAPRGDAPVADPDADEPVQSAPSVPIQRAETIVLTAEDLPVEELDSREADNSMTYTWDEAALRITDAGSSVTFDPAAQVEMLGQLDLSDDGIAIDVTITNRMSDRTLHVAGRVVHRIFDSTGALVATLESDPIDETLSPGGATTVEFEYLLPSGSYVVESAFERS